METPCLARPEPVKWTRSGVVRSGQQPAQFGGIGDRVDERLPWLHDQAGACAGGLPEKVSSTPPFPAQKVAWMSPFPVFGRKGVLHATFFQPKRCPRRRAAGAGVRARVSNFWPYRGCGRRFSDFWSKLGPASPTAPVAEDFTLFRRAFAAESYSRIEAGLSP